jgi:hypothetical protein
MSVFARGPRHEVQPDGGGSSLHLDLELRACPSCRRELHPWERECPADGTPAVARAELGTPGLPAPPAHLLEDDA